MLAQFKHTRADRREIAKIAAFKARQTQTDFGLGLEVGKAIQPCAERLAPIPRPVTQQFDCDGM